MQVKGPHSETWWLMCHVRTGNLPAHAWGGERGLATSQPVAPLRSRAPLLGRHQPEPGSGRALVGKRIGIRLVSLAVRLLPHVEARYRATDAIAISTACGSRVSLRDALLRGLRHPQVQGSS